MAGRGREPTDHLRGGTYAQNITPETMPTGIAATSTAPQRERRSRTAVGATAGRSHRVGTNRSAGHRRRAQTTIRSASRLSIAALSPLCIARGCVRVASAANAADRHPPRSFPRATSLLLSARSVGAAPALRPRSRRVGLACLIGVADERSGAGGHGGDEQPCRHDDAYERGLELGAEHGASPFRGGSGVRRYDPEHIARLAAWAPTAETTNSGRARPHHRFVATADCSFARRGVALRPVNFRP